MRIRSLTVFVALVAVVSSLAVGSQIAGVSAETSGGANPIARVSPTESMPGLLIRVR